MKNVHFVQVLKNSKYQKKRQLNKTKFINNKEGGYFAIPNLIFVK